MPTKLFEASPCRSRIGSSTVLSDRPRSARSLDRLTAEGAAQLVLRACQRPPSRGAQLAAGAIDVEVEHRHRRTERIGLAPTASLGGPLERARDLRRIGALEHAG